MSTENQRLQRELDALVAQMVEKLIAPVGNPLLAIEQLRGRVLRYPLPEGRCKQLIEERLVAIQNCCDELHLGLHRHPEIERWRTELVAYERAEHQRERANARKPDEGEAGPSATRERGAA
jgi:hypothetical protein